MIEIERVLGNQAARRCYVSSVQCCETSVASEHSEDSDALVRTECGPLARDQLLRARDRSGEADAVFSSLNVVVHCFGNGDNGKALPIENGGEAQSVVSADGDEAIDIQAVEVLEDDRSEVIIFPVKWKLLQLVFRNVLRNSGFGHFARIRPRRMEHGPTAAIDCPCILARERASIVRVGFEPGIHVRESFPPAANADHFATDFASPVHNRLDNGIQAGHISTARKNSYLLRGHPFVPSFRNWSRMFREIHLACGSFVTRFYGLVRFVHQDRTCGAPADTFCQRTILSLPRLPK